MKLEYFKIIENKGQDVWCNGDARQSSPSPVRIHPNNSWLTLKDQVVMIAERRFGETQENASPYDYFVKSYFWRINNPIL